MKSKMSQTDTILIFSILFYCLLFDKSLSLTKTDTCLQETPCRCRYSDGSGIDISNFLAKNSVFTTKSENLTYYFHPCTDINIHENTNNTSGSCASSSICIFNSSDSTYKNIGVVKEAQFSLIGDPNLKAYLIYKHAEYTTRIQLSCDKDLSDPLFTAQKMPDTKTYSLILISPDGCVRDLNPSDSLSTGSVLVILFLTLSTVYLLGGALVLRFLRGARGKEIIPNLEFWIELPSLVKEGAIFIQNGCRISNAVIYDQI